MNTIHLSQRLLALASVLAALSSMAEADTYKVKGKLQYFDGRTSGNKPLGQTNGAGNVRVEIWDKDTGDILGDDLVATTTTDADGNFSKTFEWWDPFDGRPDVYIKFVYENSKWRVVPGDFDAPYSVKSSTDNEMTPNVFHTFNKTVSGGSIEEKAMWVFQSMNETWDWIEVDHDINWGSQIRVNFPSTLCTVSCTPGDNPHISLSAASRGFTVAHEYGHALQFRLWSGNMPGANYCLTEGSGASNCGHSWSSQETSYAAFIEGWADYVALTVLGAVGTSASVEGISDVEFRVQNSLNSQNEGNVAAVLADIIDANADNNVGTGFDGINRTMKESCSVLQHMDAFEHSGATIRDFIDEYREVVTSISGSTWQSLANNSWVSYTP